MDETNLNIHIYRSVGRSLRGRRCTVVASGSNVYMIACIGSLELIHHEMKRGLFCNLQGGCNAVDAHLFEKLIQSLQKTCCGSLKPVFPNLVPSAYLVAACAILWAIKNFKNRWAVSHYYLGVLKTKNRTYIYNLANSLIKLIAFHNFRN